MNTQTLRNAQEAFDLIHHGLRAQGEPSTRLFEDSDGNRDPYGFVIGDNVEITPNAEEMTFSEINATFLNGQWSSEACEIIELCQQIHDYIPTHDWEYQLGAMAKAEGLAI